MEVATNTFALPPPATPPVSPKVASPRHKRTLSTSKKEDDYDLPPPPSRARKIIQMKPKNPTSISTSPASASASTHSHPDPAPPTQKTGAKRKQPTPTSAAGRKIARKTAHSIIERRRRSKMNEEFGVLKDMIPACEGVEMHKLAILQAGIEYVRYLEGCIRTLKGEDDEEGRELKRQATGDWTYRKTSLSSEDPSPDIAPIPSNGRAQHRPVLPSIASFSPASAGQGQGQHSATPTPTLLSPAFNAIHFSPDLSRTTTASTGRSSVSTGIAASPNILPLPQALMPLAARMEKSASPLSEGGAEATATAALMMMGNDRRSAENRGKGMSVKDLLTS
jgi:hypothetical protein